MDPSLFHAVLAAPYDDAPRLVYADALTENDDPRGEFIAVQCRISSGRVKGEALKALKNRESELLEAHREEWFGPFEKWLRANDAYGLSQLKVQRGFVTQCRAQLVEPDTLQRVFDKAPLLERLIVRGAMTTVDSRVSQLTHLDADGPCASVLSSFLQTHALPFLSHLTLRFGYLPLEIPLEVSNQPSLRVLEVERAVTPARLPTLLERLAWSGAVDATMFRSPLPNLRAVQVGVVDAEVVEALVALAPQLESLAVGGRVIGPVQRLFTAKWPNLKHFDLSSITLGPQGAKLVAGLSAPKLESLDLTNTRVKPEGAWTVLRSPLIKTLRQLSLRANRLTDGDLAELGALKHQLVLLNLKKNPLGAVFLKKLQSAWPETKLTR